MAGASGQGPGPDVRRALLREVRRTQWARGIGGLLVGIVAISLAMGYPFGGVLGADVEGSPSNQGGAVGLLSGEVVAKPAPPGAAAATPAVGTGAADHVSLTATGLSPTGRTFSYGYDLASAVPSGGAEDPDGSAGEVARTIPGAFEDVPIMGWGVGNPEPSPGVYNFSTIARQIAFVESTGGIPVITLCAAPDWMKGGQPGVTDWSQIDVAPLPQYFQDFADLSAAIADAFPQVKYFVVWNEMKGFWDQATNSWDAADYTSLYNDTFRAIKTVRPGALVGGPYVSIESRSGPSSTPATPSGPWGHLDPVSLSAISYWLAHKVGADFIAVDGRAFTQDAGLTTDPLTSTEKYAAADRWLSDQTALPIVWMESHVLPDPSVATQQQQAALRIAVLLQMASSGASLGMQWDPDESAAWDEGLWASTNATTVQPTVLAQELPPALAVLAAPVTLVAEQPGTLEASGPDGSVTVEMRGTTSDVIVTGPPA